MYIGCYIFLFLLALREKLICKERHFCFLWGCCFLLLVMHDGLRWETGTDWRPYYLYFENCLHIKNSGFEIGYVQFNEIIRRWIDSYTVLLLLHALILYLLVFRSLRHYSRSPFLSLLLYYVVTLPYLGMNRQFLAIGICFYSLRFLIEQKSILYFMVGVVLASLFHRTAYIFFIVPLLVRVFPISLYAVVAALAIVLSILGLPVKLLDFLLNIISNEAMLERAEIYGSHDATLSMGLGLFMAYLRRLMWIIPFLYIYARHNSRFTRQDLFFFNLYFLGFVLYVLFNGTQYQIVVSRALLYFNIMECIIVAKLLAINKNRQLIPLLYAIVFIYGLIQIDKGLSSYERAGADNLFVPYKGVFINVDYQRRMW